MQIIFYFVAFYGLFFFIAQRRQFDFLSTSFIGELIYFAPGFGGYVGNPYVVGDPTIPILPETYGVWIYAMLGSIAAGYYYRGRKEGWENLATDELFDATILAIISISLPVALYRSGLSILSADKFEVLDNIDRTWIVFSTATQIGFIAFVIQGKWLKASVPAIGLIFLLYSSFRYDFALAVIAVATYFAATRGIWTYIRPRFFVPLIAAGAVLLVYKPFLTAYRGGNLDLFLTLFSAFDVVRDSLVRSEPFFTQSILNEVIGRDFSVGAASLLMSFAAAVPFLAPLLGIQEGGFSFQEQLFPNLGYGLASNIYANFYGTLGWFGIIIFVPLHNLCLMLTSQGAAKSRAGAKVLYLSWGAFFAFYIHRNDIVNSLSTLNRSLIIVAFTLLISFLLRPRAESDTGPAVY